MTEKDINLTEIFSQEELGRIFQVYETEEGVKRSIQSLLDGGTNLERVKKSVLIYVENWINLEK